MKGLELLETYPKAAKVIRDFFTEQLLNSLNDNNLSDEFKEFAKEQGINNDTISGILDSAPRGLFDVLDDNGIFIEITVVYGEHTFFIYHINGDVTDKPPYYKRKEAELAAIERAVELLNNKL